MKLILLASCAQFEAILFAVLACSFYLLESFVDDLEDPFGGSWTVDAALDACDECSSVRIVRRRRQASARRDDGPPLKCEC